MKLTNPSPSLHNEDLAPAAERKWGAFSIFNVWTSDVHSLWGADFGKTGQRFH